MNLVKRLLASVEEQNAVVALSNCFNTWDGHIDVQGIAHGIIDRMEALGGQEVGVRIARTSLNTVTVEVCDIATGKELLKLRTVTYKAFGTSECYYVGGKLSSDSVFHDDELCTMADVLAHHRGVDVLLRSRVTELAAA